MNKKKYNSQFLYAGIAAVGFLFISMPSTTFTGGAPASYTNAPTTGTNREANCTSCHAGTLQTSGTNYNNVSFSGNFTGSGYIPDSTYTLTLSYTHTGKTKFGYQLTCLSNNNTMAGSFATITGNTRSSIISGTTAAGTRQYVRQTSAGTSGSGSASWSFRWTAPSSNLDTVTVYAVVNSTNSNGANSGDIIIAREFKIAPSTLLPSATASATNDTICQGELITLNGASTNTATTWNWTTAGGSPTSATTQNATIRYNSPGTYNAILKSTNVKGISLPDTLVVTVLAAPSPSVAGGATQQFCEGDSLLLSSSVNGGATYVWNTGKTGPQLWVTQPGTYSVSATGINGCSRVSNSVTTSFYAKPSTSLTSNATPFVDSTCTNNTVELSAGSDAFDSFFFFADGVLMASLDSSTWSTLFTKQTTYGLQVMNSQGCLSDTAYLVMKAKEQSDGPTVTCSATTPSSITFEWTSATAHLGYEISTNEGSSWQTPSSGTTGTSHLVTGLQPQDSVILWVRSMEAAPCSYSKVSTAKCFSQACSQLDAKIQAADALCFGDLWTIQINGLAGKNYSLALDGGSQFTDTIFSFNPTTSRDYLISIVDSNNLVCPARQIALSLTVDRIADIDLKAGKLGAYCIGEEITYVANDSIDSFNYYVNNILVQSGTSNRYTATQLINRDSIYVIVTKGECIDTSTTEYVNIEATPTSEFSYSRSGSQYSFSPVVDSYKAYRWNFGDGSETNTEVLPTHDFESSAGQAVDVILEVESASGCKDDTVQRIALPDFASLHDLSAIGITVYPNPTTDVVYIDNQSGKTFQYSLFSITGEVITSNTLTGTNESIDLSSLPKGIYILRGFVDSSTETSIRISKK